MRENKDLRQAAKTQGVPLWRIADALTVSEQTLIRHWRKELTQTEKKNIMRVIERLAKEVRHGTNANATQGV